MRIDNHMAGYRPPPPKSKKMIATTFVSATFRLDRHDRPSMLDGQYGKAISEDGGRNYAQQNVHKRSNLEKIAQVLDIRGVL
jgi:hypothetical protein